MTEKSEAVATPQPAFAPGKPRSEDVPLEWPIDYQGKHYAKLTVRRVSTAQIADYAAQLIAKDPEAILGNVIDEDGEVVPLAVMQFLDDDDDKVVGEVISRFLPRVMRETDESTSDTSTTSSPSQHPNSAPPSPGSSPSNGDASATSPTEPVKS